MKKFALLAICLILVCIITTGCSAAEASGNTSYPAVVAWNYIVYGLSVETVSIESIDREIGQVQRNITALPKKNGDSNTAVEGSKLYSIKDVSVDNAIVVDMDGVLYKASKSWQLQ